MKKLRVGMIGGGGPGSFFGQVHLRAISLDNSREVVAGALRSDPGKSLEAAGEWGIEGFETYQDMIKAWQSGALKLDYVTIATPNHAHFAPAKACVEAGLPVLCEKPMTMTVNEAETLVRLAEDSGVPFVLAHTYTGHPMLMMARELVLSGTIGKIRKIESWYNQGWLSGRLEDQENQQAAWRTDPARSGISNCGGDIGSHAFMAATWVSGLSVTRVSARLNKFVEGRELDDDFNVIAELNNGGTAIITATQIAVGYRNDHGIRLFGATGSLEWSQEAAEKLLVRMGDCDRVHWLGANNGEIPEAVRGYLRLPPGHHEDFLEALANLHCTIERRIRAVGGEEVPPAYPHPGVGEGLETMRFVKAAVDSSAREGAWTSL